MRSGSLGAGGFTCGIIAFVLVPILGIFFKSKDEKLAK